MKNTSFLFLFAASAVFLSCQERIMSDEESSSARGPVPDLTFRLDAKVRQRLQSRFDVDALELLLQRMSVKDRQNFIGSLGATPPGQPQSSNRSGYDQEERILIRDSDPARQALLEKVWAPYWDHLPQGAVDDPSYPYPGRELARLRQAERKRRAGESSK
jgi:hypothetical protein